MEAPQNWVRNLHFYLYLGQFLTDFQNSFFLWKLMKIAIWLKSGCAIAHPLPPPLVKTVQFKSGAVEASVLAKWQFL